MKNLRRLLQLGLTACLLAACAGTGGSGPGAAGGPVGGEAPGSSGLSAVEPSLPVGGPTLGQASGDGTLSSQSPNVDLEPNFYRLYALYFAGEKLAQGAGYDFVLPEIPGTLPAAQVLKIFRSGPSGYKEVPCLACEGRYVRAVNCGAHSDADILKLIPPEEQNNPVASNPLIWFLLHMPRPFGGPAATVCEGAVYRDFAVKNSGIVDLKELELHPNEIVVFYLLPEHPPAEAGPVSTGAYAQIGKEGIAATAAEGLIRFVRPRPPLRFMPQDVRILKTP